MSMTGVPEELQNSSITPPLSDPLYADIGRSITETIQDVTDLMEENQETITAVLTVHDFLLQVKNFGVACGMATGAINMATAAKRMMQGIPMVLVDQGVARAVTSTEIGSASVYAVIAAGMLIHGIMEMNKIEKIRDDVGAWLQNALDDYSHQVLALQKTNSELEKFEDTLSVKEKLAIKDIVENISEHFTSQQWKNADEERLRSADDYVDNVRRAIKKDKKENDSPYAGQIKALSRKQREYFYLVLKQHQMQRVIKESQDDMMARVDIHSKGDGQKKLYEIVTNYPLNMLGAKHAAFHQDMVKHIATNTESRSERRDGAADQRRERIVKKENRKRVEKAQKKVGLCALNLLGALCMMSAILLGPTFPPAAVVLFVAAITINVILLRYAKEFPSIGDTFASLKRGYHTKKMRAGLFYDRVHIQKKEREILKLTASSLNKIESILPKSALVDKESEFYRHIKDDFYQAYQSTFDLLSAFYKEIKTGTLSLKDTEAVAERILSVIREALKGQGLGADATVLKPLTDLYAVVPGAPPLDLDRLRVEVSEAQRPPTP